MDGHSIHQVHADAYHAAWDRSLEPALEIEPGTEVAFAVRDAPRLCAGATPVSGPVFLKGAQPGDALEVEILEFAARDWGWTAIIPGFGLLPAAFLRPGRGVVSADRR